MAIKPVNRSIKIDRCYDCQVLYITERERRKSKVCTPCEMVASTSEHDEKRPQPVGKRSICSSTMF